MKKLAQANLMISVLGVILLCSQLALARGPEGGSVWSIAISPSDPDIMYVGTSGGGVFKSTDGGDSWVAINVGLTNLSVHALALDPQDTNTIYAGTNGSGVFVSHDGGETWR